MNNVIKGTLLGFSILLIFGSFFVFNQLQNKNEEIAELEKEVKQVESKQKKEQSSVTVKESDSNSDLVVKEKEEGTSDNNQKSVVAEKFAEALYSYSAEDVANRNEIIKETTTSTLHDSLIVETAEPDTSTTMKVNNVQIYQSESDGAHLLVCLEQTTRIADSETRMDITLKLSLQQVDNHYLVNSVQQLSAISK
ncbi:hypothetical protein D9N27_09255 [Listeria monocytogenes]|uniref:hypothetical protein n=1 Tax=Listeria seeligeri TaxID=1640 RepID=UPI0010B55025|nr:hypothetical protein [Listeria seeligeri]EAC4184097.1 hypothetical protein [Listeria monocytogenes]EEO3421827.1 hypothetical protein [Listeria monocytogenes]MBF2629995.1 hypothetical protein [Listeria seeligeri]